MASNILIKRSTGSTAPGSITFGELATTIGANGTQANAGDRLFVGDNNGAAQPSPLPSDPAQHTPSIGLYSIICARPNIERSEPHTTTGTVALSVVSLVIL